MIISTAVTFIKRTASGGRFVVALALPALIPQPVSAESVPDHGYLFAHFYNNGESGLHLAWSADGLKWNLLNNGESYIVPQVGESKLMRDPSLVYGPDGMFHMVWTTSWGGLTIGYASSPDLISWSEQRALPVMGHEPDAANCWAPEIHWDPTTETYLILWSTTIPGTFPETALSNRRPTRNHRIYSTNTRDFIDFTPTRLHYDGGFNVIDAALAQTSTDWVMVVKNEELSPKTQKNIRVLRAPTPYGPFTAPSEPISTSEWSEGPYIIQVGDAWHVYYDQHMVDVYGLVRSYDLLNWEPMDGKTSFPPDVNHGSFVKVPGSVIQHLIEATPDAEDHGAALTPDQSDQLQQRIDSLATAGGGVLQLGPGRFVSEPIYLRSNVSLELSDQTELVLAGESAPRPWESVPFLVNAKGVDTVALSGGKLDATNGGAVLVENSSAVQLTGFISSGHRGVQISGSSDVGIDGIQVSSISLPAMFLSDNQNLRVRDFSSLNTSNEPIIALHNARKATVSDSAAIRGNRTFVLVQGSATEDVEIRNIDRSGTSAVFIVGPDVLPDRVIIE